MYIKKVYGYVLPYETQAPVLKGRLDFYNPPTAVSTNWKHWVAQLDLKTCRCCRDKHGEVYSIAQMSLVQPPVHPNCRCQIKIMDAVFAGDGTKDGQNGADWWIKNYGTLPNYYISKTDISKLNWRPGDAPARYASGMMVAGGIYKMMTVICPETSTGFGMRQISTIIAENETDIVYCGQMTA